MLEPVNTVLKAVRRLSLLRGDVVLVAGQGPIGLMFTRLLQLAGIRVIATDLFASRLKLAKKFGAEWVLNVSGGREGKFVGAEVTRRATQPAFSTLIRRATRGRGLDAAIVTVPSDAVVSQSLDFLRGGGQLMLFAHTQRQSSGRAELLLRQAAEHRRPATESEAAARKGLTRPTHFSLQPSAFSLDLSSICVDEKDLLGSYSSDFTLQAEVARLVFSRRLDVRPLISHVFPLEETAQAVALAARPTADSLKILVAADDESAPISNR